MIEVQDPLTARTPPALTGAEVTTAFISLRALMAECLLLKLNKNELATILIKASITEGFDTGRRITGTLEKLGLNRRHAGKILSDGTGNNAQRDLWQRNTDGRYVVHLS